MFEDSPESCDKEEVCSPRFPFHSCVSEVFSLYCCVVDSAARNVELKFCMCVSPLRVQMFSVFVSSGLNGYEYKPGTL